MNYLGDIQRGVDYIEAHLTEDIDIVDVAQQAGLSRWHFQRMFKALTGETVKTYIRSRRLAHAMHRLLTSDDRILDIAFEAGYETHESFTRAFKSVFKLTPTEYRTIGDSTMFLKKVEFDAGYLEHLNSNIKREPTFFDQSEMTVVGKQTIFYNVDSDKNNIGSTLPQLWEEYLPVAGNVPNLVESPYYGVIGRVDDISEELTYCACREVSRSGSAPSGFTEMKIPSATYASFAHRGDPLKVDHTVNFIYGTWLLTSGMRHTNGPDLEIYGDQYSLNPENSTIHYAIPVTVD